MGKIVIEDLKVCYDTRSALWDICVEIPLGKTIAVVGPNGAGKSTLIKAMVGIVKPLTGQVLYEGKPLMGGHAKIAYVPQRSGIDWDFPITVLEVALMGLYSKKYFWKPISKIDKQKAMHVLERLGLEKFIHRQISELSGGQQQRLFIARALLQDAECYFF
ncbi:MAG: ATP-binding cassette domain-containing protein, partial [Chlamydiae bacterium]|nr:ATP-binding cassette domain-containing protein [Chlamydiota bacterium]